MKLRLIVYRKEKILLCPNGSMMKVDNEILCRLLTEFNKPNNFKGDLGYWNKTIAGMEDVSGKTLLYVDDTLKLIVFDHTIFASVVSSNKYISATEYAEKYGKQVSIIKRICSNGRIEGAYKTSAGWMIPENAPYPERKPREVKKKE